MSAPTKSTLLLQDHKHCEEKTPWTKRSLFQNPLLKKLFPALAGTLILLAPHLLTANPNPTKTQQTPPEKGSLTELVLHIETSGELALQTMTTQERIDAWEEAYGVPPIPKEISLTAPLEKTPEAPFDITELKSVFAGSQWTKIEESLKTLTTKQRLDIWEKMHGEPATAFPPTQEKLEEVPETPFETHKRSSLFTQETWKNVLENEKKDTALEILSKAPEAPDPTLWKGGSIFPNGKAPLKLINPYKDYLEKAHSSPQDTYTTQIIPNDILKKQLQPAGGETLLKKIVENYEKEKDTLPFTLQYKQELNTPIPITFNKKASNAHYIPSKREVLVGLNQTANPTNLSKDFLTRNGYVSQNGLENPNMKDWALGHELRHAWMIGKETPHQKNVHHKESANYEDQNDPTKNPYQTAIAEELKQGIGAFLTLLRSQTGREFLDPQEIRQAIKELEENPKLQSRFPEEPMRIFNTLQTLKKTNPEKADQLLNALCGYGKFLVSAPQPQDFSKPQQKHIPTAQKSNEPQMC